MGIVGNAKLVWNSQQERVGLGDPFVLLQLLDQDIRHGSVDGQDWYRLRLFEEENPLGTRYCVLQMHVVWKGDFLGGMWESEELEHFWILDEAKARYAERKAVLTIRGYIYSDMDM